MRLDKFSNPQFDRGRPVWVEGLWVICSGLFFSTWLPGSRWRCALLRAFGARVGRDVVIKPRARVKFPWRLTVGDYAWIGEDVWIDNLDQVSIGAHCCISQGAYFCTGNHRWDKESFDLVTEKIVVEDHCWIAAKAIVMRGAVIREGAVVLAGMVVSGEVPAWQILSSAGSRPRQMEDKD